MKIYALLKSFFVFFLHQSGNAGTSFDRWQCSPLSNNTIQSFVEQDAEAFRAIGWPNWMLNTYWSINCSRAGLKRIPQKLDTKVEILDLGENLITHLGKNDLAAYSNLVALFLSSNCLISHFYRATIRRCTTFLTVESGTFVHLKNLKFLTLSSTAMKQLPEMLPRGIKILMASFASLSPIHKRDVEHLSSLELVSFSTNCIMSNPEYYCARHFTISDPVFSSPHLKFLDLAYNNFTSVPRYLFQQSLIGIKLQGNPLRWVRSNDFNNATNITYLNLAWTSQYIKTPLHIENGSFDLLRSLEVLDISANMISSLPVGLFSKNTKLRALNLEFNCLKMIETNPDIIPPLPFLEELSLAGNTFCNDTLNPQKKLLPRLDFGTAFLRFQNLTTLSLGIVKEFPNSEFIASFLPMYFSYGSKYDVIDSDSFRVLRNLTRLKNLGLVACGIRVFQTAAVENLSLSHLDMQMNEIGEASKNTKDSRFKRRILNQKECNNLDLKLSNISAIHQMLFNQKTTSMQKSNESNAVMDLSKNAISNLRLYSLKYFRFVSHLDLSRNHINYIDECTFQHLSLLRVLNLRYNPIRNIHPNALIPLVQLTHLQISLTEYQQDFSIQFLQNTYRDITLSYGDTSSHIYSLLHFYGNVSISFKKITALDLSYIPILNSALTKNMPLFKPFPKLKKLIINGAKITFPPQSKLFEGLEFLQYLSMQKCWLEEFPYLSLKNLRNLEHLDLSHNKIEVLDKRANDNFHSLKMLILSHNFIYKISPKVLRSFWNNGLRKIDISFNQIKNINHTIIDKYMLETMDYIDLRGNVVSCDCSLSDTFGWMIQDNESTISSLPGFIPDCSIEIINYYGGCIACDYSSSDKPLSLFTYIITNNCKEQFLLLLVAIFNCIILLFLITATTFKSLKKKLLNFLLNDIRIQSVLNSPTNEPPFGPRPIYVYDGFVYYDNSNPVVGDWVDHILIPRLENGDPSFKISVVGKEDWCGLTQVQHLLLKMRASRKCIIVLSDSFLSTPQCQYVLSVLEEYIFVYKEDKCILIGFDHDETKITVSKLFRKTHSRNSNSMLRYDLSEDNSLFWDVLVNAMILPSNQSRRCTL